MRTHTQRYYINLLFDRNIFSSEGCMGFSQINMSWKIILHIKKRYVTVTTVICNTIVANSSASSAHSEVGTSIQIFFLKTHFKLNSHGFSCEEETFYGTCIVHKYNMYMDHISHETTFIIYVYRPFQWVERSRVTALRVFNNCVITVQL